MSGAGAFFAKVLSRFQTRPTPDATPATTPTAIPSVPTPAQTEPVPPVEVLEEEVVVESPEEEEFVPRTITAQSILKSAAGPRRTAMALQRSDANANVKAHGTSVRIQPPSNEPYDPSREEALQSLEAELLTLCNLTGSTLVRAKRPPIAARTVTLRRHGSAAAKAAENGEAEENEAAVDSSQANIGPLEKGTEIAQMIEQRARGMLLETSLTRTQHDRIDRVLQSVVDLLCALRASRYAWQISQILPLEGPSGRALMPRVRRVVEHTIEMSSRVTFAIEGKEGAAAAVAEHYREFLSVKAEASAYFADCRESGTLTQDARRLVRAALLSLTVAAESMAKVAARFALPLGTSRQITQQQQDRYRSLDRGDDLLAPLPRR